MSTPIAPPATFSELIERWGNIADFARETNQPYERVKRWRALNNIKPKYWRDVKLAAADPRRKKLLGFAVDDALLVRLADETERRRDPQSSEAVA